MAAPQKASPVRATMLSSQTYDKLKNMIYDGRLKPGQRLVERDLSRSFSVSRIPLRECLVRLESEGLIRKVAHAAQYVEDFSEGDLLEIYSMRLVLEPMAARLAAIRKTVGLIGNLRDLCSRMTLCTKAGDWANLDAVDYQFHHAIVEASQHRRLIRAYEPSHIQITGRRADYHHLRRLPANATAKEHLRIIEALDSGDSAKAAQRTYQHVLKAMQALESWLGLGGDGWGQLTLVSEAKANRRRRNS